MMKTVELKLKPEEISVESILKRKASSKIGWKMEDITEVRLLRRSIDARGAKPVYRLNVAVYKEEVYSPEAPILEDLKDVSDKPAIVIVGAGPAGYFAALELIELGLRPIILDRGKDVQARRRDLKAIQQDGIVNPHSNYCYGEGGAGTYSDGKLYTRSHKRGNIYKALRLLVEHGAKTDILVDAHPHIGSNKLPQIVANIRETIKKCGGTILFDHYVTDLILHEGQIKGVVANEENFYGESVILATGHSARDIYQLLHQKNITLEAKPFALGVRIEHPQPLIDKIQYRLSPRGEHLPASSYRLACQIGEVGVFSFCMCPGGLVVPASTAPGELVVNGMSLSRRDSPFANSGTVVSVLPEDLEEFKSEGVFAGMAFQRSVEQAVFGAGNGSQQAPAQRLTDFVNGKLSSSLADTSYIPGLYAANLAELMPERIIKPLQKAVHKFGNQMKGYFTEEANVIATESRTSSPVRIPRNKLTFMHDDCAGLFPCGEGAGYAGGIISAAMDGQNVAKAVQRYVV